MAAETPNDPKKPAVSEPFIGKEERPDLTIDLNKKVGDLTARDLQTLLGSGSQAKPFKEVVQDKPDIPDKVSKDNKDHKETKDNKEHKDHKEQKDNKDHKDTKDHKEQKDNKEHKDTKDTKEHKDFKDHIKDHKEIIKEIIKEVLIEKVAGKESFEKIPDVPDPKGPAEGPQVPGPGPVVGLEDVIRRLTGLEKEVEEMRGKKVEPPKHP